MNEADQIKYLTNVVLLAKSVDVLSAAETSSLEEIRKAIGAKKTTLNTAVKQARTNSTAPDKVGGFAVQVSNLADMIFISIIDGQLSDREKALITAFAQTIGLTDEQLRQLTKDALERVRGAQGQISCPSCGAKIVSDSNFCPKCGASIEGQADNSAFTIPKLGYAIEFCESSSARFEDALNLAKTAPTFASTVRNKKTWFLAAWPETALTSVVGLADLLSGIRNRKCYFNGADVSWDELFGFVWCAAERDKAYRPIEYCFGKESKQLNPWGCVQAGLDWTEWAQWFSYGRFERSGILKGNRTIWVFDKQRIEHELLANLHRVKYCPHLRSNLIRAVLNALPNSVEVTDSGPWKYSRSYNEIPGSIKVVEKRDSGGIQFEDEYYADGVRPNGLGQLEDILKTAFAEAGITDVTPYELIR